MDGFQPRIENPPPRSPSTDKGETLRRFVIEAAGQWCIVGELKPKPGHDALTEAERSSYRGKLYTAMIRTGAKGGVRRDIQLRSHFDGATFKVYARYTGAKQTTDSKPNQESQSHAG